MAVCPAGDDVISPYLADRARYREEVLVPFLRHSEPVYVKSGTRAEKVASRNPSKQVRFLDFKPDLSTTANFALGLRHMFLWDRAGTTSYRVVFRFPDGAFTATVDKGRLTVSDLTSDLVEATVVCDTPEYIRMLHRPVPDRPPPDEGVHYTVEGDPDVVQHLLSCLG